MKNTTVTSYETHHLSKRARERTQVHSVQPRSASTHKLFWVTLFFCGCIGTLGCLRAQATTHGPKHESKQAKGAQSHESATTALCIKPKSRSEVHGWIERIEGDCALLWLQGRGSKAFHRSALPPKAKEGDYIHHGVHQPQRSLRLKQQVRRLLWSPPRW